MNRRRRPRIHQSKRTKRAARRGRRFLGGGGPSTLAFLDFYLACTPTSSIEEIING